MKPIAMRSIDVYGSVADHDGIVIQAALRAQSCELLPFVHANITAADECESISQPEVDQDALGENRQLGRADSQHCPRSRKTSSIAGTPS